MLFFMTSEIRAQSREIFTLQKDWKFIKGNPEKASETNFDASAWQDVTIPHDWAISEPFIIDGDGNTGKLPWKGQGWYRKKLEIPSAYKNKRIILIFDGVMAFPKVYINGKLAGEWDYGYNSFHIDVTDYVNFGGENILAVHADTRKHDSRWYPGGGIYRKVQLLVVNPIHVAVWGTYITTPIVKPNYADVRINTSVQNQSATTEEIKVEQVILNSKGIEVSKASISRSILSGTAKDFEVTAQLTNPTRWDIDNPVLYKAVTTIYKNDEVIDTYSTSFGIRTIQFTADDGFHLNERRVQLKGVNLHSDFGPLGVAFNSRAMERQLEIMKSMGVNAIRNSHNVAAPELLELCDKMGILVFNEAFDKYDAKIDMTSETDFEDYAHRNIRNFVVRDRNHPSIFIWSVGNEIGDVQNNINNGFKKLHTMVNYVNKYDPSRPVTLVNDNMESANLRHFDYYDVHSWNYGRRYRLARKLEPNKSVIISESASTVSTRGFYEFPLPKVKDEFTKSLQVSSYDLNAPEWAEIADDDFMWQQDESYVAGEFVWTGFDYLGEPTPYFNEGVKKMGMTDKEASRSSYFGIVDLVGIPKDRYFLYKSYWKPEETTIHILPHWNWEGKEGENIPVFVYTNGDCAELFINGKSQGKQCKKPSSKISTERFRLMWNDVIYEPGEVKVIAYKEGVVIGEKVMRTAGKPYEIKLTADKNVLKANGSDLSYILVEAYDKEGNLCPLANNKVEITLEGKGHVAGVGNGNPQSFSSFKSNYVHLFYGKAMIILGSDFEKGKTKLTAKTDGLIKDSKVIVVE
jgi:beta-galactosidase